MEEGEMEVAMAEEDNEEEAAKKRSPYDLLEETRTSMEEIVAKMLFIKKEGRPKADLRELVTQISLHFINLRQVNRAILLEEDRVKSETESAKVPVDFATLQLHNFMYEKNHYMKAIKACKDFKTKHPDITLVDEEEFYRDAPEEIKGNQPNGNAHDLMLRRLDFELFQRKELCKQREELERCKKSLQEIIATRKKFLTSLPSHLKSLKKASMPVQQQLGISHTKKLKQHHSAELLPPPLYMVFSQLMAHKEAFGDNIELEIVGSMKDAQAIARQQANKDNGNGNMEDARLEDDAGEEDDDGQRRRKRPKRAHTKDNLDVGGLNVSHPLHVILHVFDDEGSDAKPVRLATLRFEYLQKLNVVFVGTEPFQEGKENILCNLFPDDTGVELPHQAAKLIVEEGIIRNEKKASRPFKWAQHLAGIDFLPEVSPLLSETRIVSDDRSNNAAILSNLSLYRQQHRVETILERIRSRMKSQMALAEHIGQLEKLNWPDLKYRNVPWALHNPLCHLESWSTVGSVVNQASFASAIDKVETRESIDSGADAPPGLLKDEVENTREDGELPSVTLSISVPDSSKTPQSSKKDSGEEISRNLILITKNITPKKNTDVHTPGKTKDMDTHSELSFGSGSEDDETIFSEHETGLAEANPQTTPQLWKDYAAREYHLVLSRSVENPQKSISLEAKVKITMEYPIRPPLFSLSLVYDKAGDEPARSHHPFFEYFNELRALETEVNLHILKMLPKDHEDHILAHQVNCLVMLFDYLMDQLPSPARNGTQLLDVGLCSPIEGRILSRYFRGRDRRRILSWKDRDCVVGYPCQLPTP